MNYWLGYSISLKASRRMLVSAVILITDNVLILLIYFKLILNVQNSARVTFFDKGLEFNTASLNMGMRKNQMANTCNNECNFLQQIITVDLYLATVHNKLFQSSEILLKIYWTVLLSFNSRS